MPRNQVKPPRRNDPVSSTRHATHQQSAIEGAQVLQNSLVAAQQLRIRELEPGEDGRSAKGRASLATTLGAMADVKCQGLFARRLEGDGSALALGLHPVGLCYSLYW